MPNLSPLWKNLREALEISTVLRADTTPDYANYASILRDNAFYLEDRLEQIRLATVPVSGCLPYAGYNTPEGYFLANGAEILIDAYRDLYNLLTNFGTVFPYGANTNGSGGAGNTHFRLPNLPAYSGVKYIIKY